jgi:L-ascorbate metabolism protein UlaG (beta-lactamase superfamily)
MKPHWLVGLALIPVGYVTRRLRKDPQFGAGVSEIPRYEGKSVAWKMGRFRNIDKTPIKEDIRSLFGDLFGYLKASNTQPPKPLPVAAIDSQPVADESDDYLTWYGHSALRLESGGQTILLDPMLGSWVAPVPFLGHRFPYNDFHPLDDIDAIDLVVFSHDHYDHLDYDSILSLRERTKAWLVPLGVGAHLKSWGIPEEDITELDWWREASFGKLTFTAAPARHFSGRSPRTRNKTLWCSFVIDTPHHRLYFGGDSGYGRHFPEIGRRFGPFDLTMLDSGQYHHRWKNVHMQPEEAVRANRDLQGRNLLPIHWGGFSLSNHPWNEPIQRIVEADEEGVVISPMIGQRFAVGKLEGCRECWWEGE